MEPERNSQQQQQHASEPGPEAQDTAAAEGGTTPEQQPGADTREIPGNQGQTLARGRDGRELIVPPHGNGLMAPPFPKGVSGNPSGRPPGRKTLRQHMVECLDMTPAQLRRVVMAKDLPQQRLGAAQIALDLTNKDPETRRRAFAEAMDRIEGKPAQRVMTVDLTPTDPAELLQRIRGLIPGGDQPDDQQDTP